ncbi:MAG: hypothetical protein WCF36_04360 [Candidatus Nanopelagicales bacterium]
MAATSRSALSCSALAAATSASCALTRSRASSNASDRPALREFFSLASPRPSRRGVGGRRSETPSYPFGREALAPLVVAVQALVLAGTFGYAAVEAVGLIPGGGGEAEVGSALVYSLLSLLAAVVVRQVLVRWRAGSDLVAAEVDQWKKGRFSGWLW